MLSRVFACLRDSLCPTVEADLLLLDLFFSLLCGELQQLWTAKDRPFLDVRVFRPILPAYESLIYILRRSTALVELMIGGWI